MTVLNDPTKSFIFKLSQIEDEYNIAFKFGTGKTSFFYYLDVKNKKIEIHLKDYQVEIYLKDLISNKTENVTFFHLTSNKITKHLRNLINKIK